MGLFFPYINGELFQAESGVVTYAASALSFLAFGYATLNSKAARAKKLLRLDQEYALGELSIFKAMGGKATLAELRGRRRVVAICAPPKQMRAAIKSAAVYRRRLSQSGVLLVGVLLLFGVAIICQLCRFSLRRGAKPAANHHEEMNAWLSTKL